MSNWTIWLVVAVGLTAACAEREHGSSTTGSVIAKPSATAPGRCAYPSMRPTYLPWQTSGEIPEPDHRSYWNDIDRAGLLWTNPDNPDDGVWLTVYPLVGGLSPEIPSGTSMRGHPIGKTIRGATGFLHDGPPDEHSAWWDLDERCNALELSVSLQGMSTEAVDEEVVKIARSLEE